VRFNHRLLFNWSLNWLFLNDRSWVLNRLFNSGSRFFFRNRLFNYFWSRLRICGLLFMSSFKCCFKSFNIFCRKN
jgi:hypothetical protein